MIDADQSTVEAAEAETTDESAQPHPPRWRPRTLPFGSDVRRALLITLVWEILTEILGYAGSLLIHQDPSDTSSGVVGQLFPGEHLRHFEAIWIRWDGNWYTDLGNQGYGAHVSNLDAFFPAYPLLIHIVGFLL